MTNWFDKGVQVGKTDGWMNLEETLAEDREKRPSLTSDTASLVQMGIDSWEETDHFTILYGQPMMDDAKEELGVDELDDDVIEKWQDNKEAFWEGYLSGRAAIGKDIYALARKLIASKKFASTKKAVPKSKLTKKSKPKSRKQVYNTQLSVTGVRR